MSLSVILKHHVDTNVYEDRLIEVCGQLCGTNTGELGVHMVALSIHDLIGVQYLHQSRIVEAG
jgi:hypothetical protein